MKDNRTYAAAIVALVALLLLTVMNAVGAPWLQDATPFPDDYPDPKKTIVVGESLTQEAALLSPTPPSGVRAFIPYQTPMPEQVDPPRGTPAGSGFLTADAGDPIEYLMGLFVPTELSWIGEHGGHEVIVYAGRDASDPEQGVLIVVRKETIWDPIGARFESGGSTGALRIVDAVDSRLVLEGEDGSLLYFDVPAGRFVASVSADLPTMTPAPTVTPLSAGPVLHDDDAPDTAGTVFNESPLNTDLDFTIYPQGDRDWFLFFLPEGRTIEVSLRDLPADYSMRFMSAGSEALTRDSVDRGTRDRVIRVPDAPPGYYLVRIRGNEGASEPHETYKLRFSDWKLEWLRPLNRPGGDQVRGKAELPVRFRVSRLDGMSLRDETAKLSLVNADNETVYGPVGTYDNPEDGIFINAADVYHHNISFRELASGVYTIRVTFEEIGGSSEFDIDVRQR